MHFSLQGSSGREIPQKTTSPLKILKDKVLMKEDELGWSEQKFTVHHL